MRIALRAGLLLVLCCVVLPALAVSGALRWKEPALDTRFSMISPDGSLLAIRRGFGKLAIFRTDTLTELREVDLGIGSFTDYAFSPDNALLAVSGKDKSRCYDVATRALLGSYPGRAWGFTAQGALVTTPDKHIVFTDPHTGRVQRRLTIKKGTVGDLALDPTGNLLAYWTGTALVLAKTTGETLHQWPTHLQAYWCELSFSPDSSLLVGCIDDNDHVTVWRVADGTVVRTVGSDHSLIRKACISPDNTTLFYTDREKGIHRIALADGTEGERLTTGRSLLRMTAGDAHGMRLVTVMFNRIAVWDLATNRTVAELTFPFSILSPVSLSPDGKLLAIGLDYSVNVDKTVVVRNAVDGTLVRTLPCAATALQFSPDGATLAVVDSDKLLLWRVADGTVQSTLQPPTPQRLGEIAFSGDGKRLFAVGRMQNDGHTPWKIFVWQLSDGSLARTIETDTHAIDSLAVSADGHYVACGHDGDKATIFDATTGGKVRTLLAMSLWQHCADFTPQGDLVAYNWQHHALEIIDVASGKVKHRLGKLKPPFGLSADGTTIICASPSTGNTIQLRSLATGAVLATLPIDTTFPSHFALSRDGTLAVTSTEDGLAVWEVK